MAIRKELPEFINGFRVVEDLGSITIGKESRPGAIFECHICSKQFTNFVRLARIYKSCGCSKNKTTLKPLDSQINGFRIIKDLGVIDKNKYAYRRCIAECKICKNNFEVNVGALRIQNSCGCSHNKKPIPEFINGFRVIKDITKDGERKRYVITECKKCGFEFTCRIDGLKKIKSCGSCCKNYPSRLVDISHSMRQRCNPRNKDRYKYHAGKSIKVCPEWMEDNVLFLKWSMENGYDDTKSIDRISAEKNYCPENCRWVSMQEQAQNNSSSVLNKDLVLAMREKSKNMSYADVARYYRVDKTTAWQAIRGITWGNI